jgi:cytochrome oxidase assembly protein ShyY1
MQFDSASSLEAASATFASRLGIEVLLFLVYAALAVWQWQRVEA